MRIAIVGLGAIGGYIAARLSAAGHDVSALARGETLARVRADGLVLEREGVRSVARIHVSDDAAQLGEQDLVVVTLKAHAMGAVAPRMLPLLGRDTTILTGMNGVSWWFLPAFMPDAPPLDSVDPGGRLLELLPLDRILGGVIHFSTVQVEPGVVRHNGGEHLIVGEACGGESDRARRVAQAFRDAGFQTDLSANVRRSVWFKLWGNMTMNPLSMLTGSTNLQILDDSLVRSFVARTMAEAAAVGACIGCAIDQSAEQRMDVTRKLGNVRTSMLVDSLAGRMIELDAIVGVVSELGRRMGVETPYTDALLGITRLAARNRGLYP